MMPPRNPMPDPAPPPTPGPPLMPGDEFCAGDPPSGDEYLRTVIWALVLLVAGIAASLTVFLGTGQVWGAASVAVGLVVGLALHLSAGRHRSVGIGAIAAGTVLLAALISYGLLWSPLVVTMQRTIAWYDPVALIGGSVIAYALTAPLPWQKNPM